MKSGLYAVIGPRGAGKSAAIRRWLYENADAYDCMYYAINSNDDKEHYRCCPKSTEIAYHNTLEWIRSAQNVLNFADKFSVVVIEAEGGSWQKLIPPKYPRNARYFPMIVFYIVESLVDIPTNACVPMILMPNSKQQDQVLQTAWEWFGSPNLQNPKVPNHWLKCDMCKKNTRIPAIIDSVGGSASVNPFPQEHNWHFDTAEQTRALVDSLCVHVFIEPLACMVVDYVKPACCSSYFWSIDKPVRKHQRKLSHLIIDCVKPTLVCPTYFETVSRCFGAFMVDLVKHT